MKDLLALLLIVTQKLFFFKYLVHEKTTVNMVLQVKLWIGSKYQTCQKKGQTYATLKMRFLSSHVEKLLALDYLPTLFICTQIVFSVMLGTAMPEIFIISSKKIGLC